MQLLLRPFFPSNLEKLGTGGTLLILQYNSPLTSSWFDDSNWPCSSPLWPTNLLSRTWRLTEAASSWAGKHVYFPESEVSACKMVNVLTVVPSAMCSGGVVWSLAPLSLPILKAEVAKGRWWLLCLHSMYVGGTKLCETTHLNWTVEDDLTKMSRSPKILTFGTEMTMEVIDLSLKVKILYLRSIFWVPRTLGFLAKLCF